jgi:hypothetical protein
VLVLALKGHTSSKERNSPASLSPICCRSWSSPCRSRTGLTAASAAAPLHPILPSELSHGPAVAAQQLCCVSMEYVLTAVRSLAKCRRAAATVVYGSSWSFWLWLQHPTVSHADYGCTAVWLRCKKLADVGSRLEPAVANELRFPRWGVRLCVGCWVGGAVCARGVW